MSRTIEEMKLMRFLAARGFERKRWIEEAVVVEFQADDA
jgi:hypothetical protein